MRAILSAGRLPMKSSHPPPRRRYARFESAPKRWYAKSERKTTESTPSMTKIADCCSAPSGMNGRTSTRLTSESTDSARMKSS